MRVEAPAKINLFLSVGAPAGGRHEIGSVMQAVSLADELAVSPGAELSLAVDPPGSVPEGADNLVLRAARVLAAASAVQAGAAFRLTKRIPVAAGLGGGSADAAAALVALNELWGTRMSRKALERLGTSVGSDVPFCVRGGTAAVWGTGEVLSPLPVRSPVWWVLGIAEARLSTGDVYRRFDELGGGEVADPFEVADSLARGDLGRLGPALRNDLEPAAFSLAPGLADGREALVGAGALGAVLSGSGPTWCGLAPGEAAARGVAAAAAGSFLRVEVVRSVPHGARFVER